MASVVRIKRSAVQGKAPRTSDLETGELALNTRDGKLFSSNGSSVFEIGANTEFASIGTLTLGNTNPFTLPSSDGSAGQILKTDGLGTVSWQPDNNSFTVQQVDGSNTTLESYSNINTLQFDEDSGFDVVNPSTGVAKIRINSTFKYWEINGVPTITAEGLDTINFVAGDGIQILASNTETKTLEIRSTANTVTSAEYVYVASQGQTEFTGVDSSNSLMTYDTSAVEVYLNGVKLIKGRDFFANNGTTIVLDDGAELNDHLVVVTNDQKQNFVSVEADLISNSHTTTSSSTEIIDSFGLADARSAKYMIQIEGVGNNNYFQVSEVLMVHNGSASFVSETNVVTSGSRVANISSDVSDGAVRLKVTPTSSINLKTKFSRLSISI